MKQFIPYIRYISLKITIFNLYISIIRDFILNVKEESVKSEK